jgi:hypothetical protein
VTQLGETQDVAETATHPQPTFRATTRLQGAVVRYPTVTALLGFIVAAMLLFHGAWAHPFTRWVGPAGDPPKFMWFLTWNPYAVLHGINPLFTHHINSETGVNLLWDTSVPLPSWLLAPVTAVFGPLFSYNVLATASPALSGFCAYLACRRYARSHWAAAIGGAMYGFSPYVIAQTVGGHMTMSLAFSAPLMFILLDEILVRQQRPWRALGVLLGVLAGAQVLISTELLVTEALCAGVVTVVLAALNWREVQRHAPYALRALGMALVVFVAISIIPVSYALESSRRPTHGTLYGPDTFVSDLSGFVVPTSYQQVHPKSSESITNKFTDSCCPTDSQTYLGVPLIAFLFVITIRRWSQPVVRVLSISAVVMLILSLGSHLHINGTVTKLSMPLKWIEHVPLISNLLASRLMMYVYLFAGMLIAIFIDGTRRRLDTSQPASSRVAAVATIAATTLVVISVFPTIHITATRSHVPSFFSSSQVHRIPKNSVALVAPFAHDTNTSEPQLWQAVAGMRFRTISGYSTGRHKDGSFGYLPEPSPIYTTMDNIQNGHALSEIDDATRQAFIDQMRADGVRTVIVGPMGQHDNMVAFFTELLGRAPETVGGVQAWFGVTP